MLRQERIVLLADANYLELVLAELLLDLLLFSLAFAGLFLFNFKRGLVGMIAI